MPGPLLRRDDLDRFRCSVPGCRACPADGRIYLHPRCHPRAGVVASYGRETGVAAGPRAPEGVGTLLLECPRCGRTLARVVVGA